MKLRYLDFTDISDRNFNGHRATGERCTSNEGDKPLDWTLMEELINSYSEPDRK